MIYRSGSSTCIDADDPAINVFRELYLVVSVQGGLLEINTIPEDAGFTVYHSWGLRGLGMSLPELLSNSNLSNAELRVYSMAITSCMLHVFL